MIYAYKKNNNLSPSIRFFCNILILLLLFVPRYVSICSAVEKRVYIKLPIFNDRKLEFSERAFISAVGERLNLPWEEFIRDNPNKYLHVANIFESFSKNKPSLFKKFVDIRSFKKINVSVDKFFQDFSNNWRNATNIRVHTVVKYDDIEFFVLSANYKKNVVYPILTFKTNNRGDFRLIHSDANYQYQLLSMWTTKLGSSTQTVLSDHEFETNNKNLGRVLSAHEFTKNIGKKFSYPPLALHYFKEVFDSSEDEKLKKFVQIVKKEMSAVIDKASNSKKPIITLDKYFGKRSVKYLSDSSKNSDFSLSKALSDLSSIVPKTVVDLGSLKVIHGINKDSGEVSLLYFSKIGERYKLVNVGHISPADSLLRAASFVKRVLFGKVNNKLVK